MTEEELEWYEENWQKGKTLKESTTDNREYKSQHVPWWVDWERGPNYYRRDTNCWKTQRKTHYRVPKKKKKKKRKDRSKEHWRYKINYSYWRWYSWRNPQFVKERERKRAAKKAEEARQKAHIEELKKTGKWIYHWKYTDFYDRYNRTWHFTKVDLNDPYFRPKYSSWG
jgi:hypothetical protein